jgi:hypothetical protein
MDNGGWMMVMDNDENNRQVQRQLARLERLKIGSVTSYKRLLRMLK